MSAYDPSRRTPRGHRRAVRRGSELFDVDGVKDDPIDRTDSQRRDSDDDRRILSELPPHWGVFDPSERR